MIPRRRKLAQTLSKVFRGHLPSARHNLAPVSGPQSSSDTGTRTSAVMPSGRGGRCLRPHSINAACELWRKYTEKDLIGSSCRAHLGRTPFIVRGIGLCAISLSLKFNLYSYFCHVSSRIPPHICISVVCHVNKPRHCCLIGGIHSISLELKQSVLPRSLYELHLT